MNMPKERETEKLLRRYQLAEGLQACCCSSIDTKRHVAAFF